MSEPGRGGGRGAAGVGGGEAAGGWGSGRLPGWGQKWGRAGGAPPPLTLKSETQFSDVILPSGTHPSPYDLSMTTMAGTLGGEDLRGLSSTLAECGGGRGLSPVSVCATSSYSLAETQRKPQVKSVSLMLWRMGGSANAIQAAGKRPPALPFKEPRPRMRSFSE